MGGVGNQPDMNAKPVKNSNCHANGLKNQGRVPHGSAGKLSQPALAASHVAATNSATYLMPSLDSAMTTGTISKIARYIGRISK